jgi:hypothetical protein
MIKRNKDMTKTVKPNMRGGTGSAEIKELLDVGEYKGAARLVAEITLEPGSSIGELCMTTKKRYFTFLKALPAMTTTEPMSYCTKATPVLSRGRKAFSGKRVRNRNPSCGRGYPYLLGFT